MNRTILALLILIPVSVLGAENRGIESTNYEASFDYYNSNFRDIYSLTAVANLPIDGVFAANLTATFSDGNGKSFSGGRGFDSTTSSMAAMLFMRDHSIGKVGAALAYSKSKNDYPSSLSAYKNQETTGYFVYGHYYLSYVTLFASRSYAENNDDFSIYASSAGLAIYLPSNFGIALSGLRANQETDFDLAITYQPSYLNNNAALTFSYNRDSEDSDFDSYTLTFSYYFGTRVSLIDRDRKYR